MVEIKITGNTPLEALASLAAFGFRCVNDPDVASAADRIHEAETRKDPQPTVAPTPQDDAKAMAEAAKSFKAPTSEEPYTEEPPYEAEPEAETPTPAPAETKKPAKKTKAAKVPSLEGVRAAGIEAAKEYGRDAVFELLEQFGASSMSTLKETDRAAFLETLEGLGEDNA